MYKKIDLEPFIEKVVQHRLNLFRVVVRQHGEVIGEFSFRNNRRVEIHSVSKSFTSIGVGIAVEEGILSLDEKPAEIFQEYLPDNPPQNLLDMTIRNMLTMTTGHDYLMLYGLERDYLGNRNWIDYVMKQPVPYKPGTHYQYDNSGPYLISVIMQKRTGQRFRDWLVPRLFDPLDIPNPQWGEDPMGHTIGCGGLILTTEEMSRLGQLCLNGGEYNGKRIVSADWIKEATSKQVENINPGEVINDKDLCAGYGYFFWRCADFDAYRGWGGYQQNMIVLPQHDAVVATNAHEEYQNQMLLDFIWEEIVPQL